MKPYPAPETGAGREADTWDVQWSQARDAKLEFANPAGSVKDRMAAAAIRAAEARGDISPGDTVVE